MTKLKNYQLITIKGVVYFPKHKKTDNVTEFEQKDIIDLNLCFDNLNLNIRCDAVGTFLDIETDKVLLDNDMQEHGDLKVLDLAHSLRLHSFIDKTLEDIKYVTLKSDKVGLCFKMSNSHQFFVLNLGDDMYIFKELPKHLLDEGYQTSNDSFRF